ncbi:hypothetical protein [Nitrincola sp.]|uniref:hypothetical protein n=1 Tax=Nitrincola sp. TaxID=1926584 RepID=UPI003A93832A
MGKCNCFDETLEAMKAHIIEKLPEGVVDFEASWEGHSFILSDRDHVPVNPQINYTYRKIKKDKTPAANLSKGQVKVFCSYCPFCGREIGEDSK